MPMKDALRGNAYLSFLDSVFVAVKLVGTRVFRRLRRNRIAHPQVCTDDVDDGGALIRVILTEAFEGVKTSEPNGGFRRAELLDGLGVKLGDATFGSI